jgi:hypothetical protein
MTGAFDALLAWLETTALALWISGSLPLTATLSAMHALGFTLVMGGAVVFNLRLLDRVLTERPPVEMAVAANRLVAAGLALSGATGLLLFAGKATAVAANGIFQTKMSLLVAAALFHFFVGRNVVQRRPENHGFQRLIGTCGLALWIALALAACAFILLE